MVGGYDSEVRASSSGGGGGGVVGSRSSSPGHSSSAVQTSVIQSTKTFSLQVSPRNRFDVEEKTNRMETGAIFSFNDGSNSSSSST